MKEFFSKIKNLSTKKLAIMITAGVVALVLLVLAIVSTVAYIKDDRGFDYLKSDLSKYIEFTGDYKNFDLNIDIAKPHDIDVDITILNLLREDKPEKAWIKGSTANLKINPGDVVYIWYRGYLVDDEGNKIAEPDGMCNFANAEPHALEIGSNGFVPGFELGLNGQLTGGENLYSFKKITTGKATEGSVAYVSFAKTTYNSDSDKTGTKTTVSANTPLRVDLSDATLDATYGEGFVGKVKDLMIGNKVEFKTKVDGKPVLYTDLKVEFVTNCETEDNMLKIDCYFPYDYGKTEFRNEDAVFEVYIEKADFYYTETPVFDDEYLKKKMEDKDVVITEEELNEYEGETLVDKYKAYSKELMQKIYEAQRDDMIESAIWGHYSKITKVKKYPTYKVDEAYYDYAIEIQNLYFANGGRIQNSYGYYDTYDTLDKYANAYLGITSSSEYYAYGDKAWQYEVYDMAKSFVKERLVLYYILRQENLIPDKATIEAEVETIKQEYLDEYIKQYLNNADKTEDDYTAEEWEEFKKARKNEILSYYDDTHFEERAYYGLASKTLVKWPNVTTLDERSAYPQDK